MLGEGFSFFCFHLIENFISNAFFFYLAVKNESNENIRTMADFCQQVPISIEQLLRVSI